MRQLLINVLLIEESKRRLTMAELTAKALFFFGLYIPMYIYTMVVTFADVRFWILTGFAVITGAWRFVRWLRRDDRMNEKREAENEALRIANRMRELEMREKELSIMERENNIIKQVGL